jgi:hypothetical protein
MNESAEEWNRDLVLLMGTRMLAMLGAILARTTDLLGLASTALLGLLGGLLTGAAAGTTAATAFHLFGSS